MVVVIVRFFGSIREASGIDAIDVPIEQDESVESLLRRLVVRFGEKLANTLYDSRKSLRREITLMVNGRNIISLNSLNTKLQGNDLVFIFTSIVGG
jgi:molybdopterin converting factor small subunit